MRRGHRKGLSMVSENNRAFVRSVNISKSKGTRKTPVADMPVTVKEQWGIVEDAHAGHWHRQVSFLAEESIERARDMGLKVKEGDFGENFTIEGVNLLALPLGTHVKIGNDVLVEILSLIHI